MNLQLIIPTWKILSNSLKLMKAQNYPQRRKNFSINSKYDNKELLLVKNLQQLKRILNDLLRKIKHQV